MRKQYHFWPSEEGLDAWDVDRLIELADGLPVTEVRLDDVAEIDSDYWFFSGDRPTVRGVVEHMKLVRDVDLSYPIIMGPDGRIMDGMHRIARTLLDGDDTIATVRFGVLPEPDFRNCRPDDLPYERN